MAKKKKKNRTEKAKFHVLFNQVHIQCLVCIRDG